MANKVAIVLRQRGQRVLLQISNGIAYEDLDSATAEAVTSLNYFATEGSNGDIKRTGDTVPPLSLGGLLVNNSRHYVTFRFLDGVLALVIQEATANLARGALVMQAVVMLLIKLCAGGTSITADRILASYAGIYLGVGSLVRRQPLNEAERLLSEIAPEDKGKARGKGEPGPRVTQQQPVLPSGRSLKSRRNFVSKLHFDLPAAAAQDPSRPRPSLRTTIMTWLDARRRRSEGAGAARDVAPPAEAPTERVSTSSWVPTFELFPAPGELQHVPMAAPQPATQLGGGMPLPFATVPVAGAVAPQGVDAEVQARLGIRTQAAAFRCRETWKGRYVGRQLRQAGVKGEVGWYPDAMGGAELPAQVTLNVDARDSLLQACLRNGYANPAHVAAAKRDDTGSLTLMVQGGPLAPAPPAPPGGEPPRERKETLLRYVIPAVVLAPPVVVSLYVKQHRPEAGEFANQNLFHVVLRVMLHAALFPADAAGARVALHVPPALGHPVKSQFHASFHPSRREVRWTIPELGPQTPALCQMLFTTGVAGSALEAAGLAGVSSAALNLKAVVKFQCLVGQTWSGFGLSQWTPGSVARDVTPSACNVAVEVEAFPTSVGFGRVKDSGDGGVQLTF